VYEDPYGTWAGLREIEGRRGAARPTRSLHRGAGSRQPGVARAGVRMARRRAAKRAMGRL